MLLCPFGWAQLTQNLSAPPWSRAQDGGNADFFGGYGGTPLQDPTRPPDAIPLPCPPPPAQTPSAASPPEPCTSLTPHISFLLQISWGKPQSSHVWDPGIPADPTKTTPAQTSLQEALTLLTAQPGPALCTSAFCLCFGAGARTAVRVGAAKGQCLAPLSCSAHGQGEMRSGWLLCSELPVPTLGAWGSTGP